MVNRKTELISLILQSLTYDLNEPEYHDEFEEIITDSTILEERVLLDMKKRTERMM
jgi:hypothetical protein